MRRLILAMAVLFGTAAHATTLDQVRAEMEAYRAEMKATTAGYLLLAWTPDILARTAGTCSSATFFTASTIVADTAPITNPVAEWLASNSNASYPGVGDILSWQTWAAAGPGTAGGATVAVYEALENWVKLTAGREVEWKRFMQVYESTVVVATSQFGESSRCWINLGKLGMLMGEMNRRTRHSFSAPMTPMQQPR